MTKLKILAQFFLDSEIGGTPLEGGHLEDAIQPLQEFLYHISSSNVDSYLAKLVRRSLPHQEESVGLLQNLLTSLDHVSKIKNINNDLIYTIKINTDTKKTIKQQKEYSSDRIKHTINDILETLSKTGDVFLPGGYVGKSSGHRMMYRLTKNKNQMEFKVYNTGAGVNYHDNTVLDSGKNGYYVAYGMTFPMEEDWQDRLSDSLTKLFELQILPYLDNPKYNYTADDVYQCLEASLTWLRANRMEGKEIGDPLLTQRAGTCVVKSLMQLVRQHFSDKSSYRLFRLAFRLHMLEQLLKDKTTLKQFSLEELTLLKRSVENTARSLGGNLNKINAEKLEKQDCSHLVFKLNDMMLIIETMRQERKGFKKESIVVDNVNDELQPPTRPEPIQNTVKILQPSEHDTLAPKTIEIDLSNLTFEQALNETLKDMRYIYDFCFIFSSLSKQFQVKNEPDVLLNKMNALLKKYKAISNKGSPESTLICLMLMNFMDRLCEEGLFQFNGLKFSVHFLHQEQLHSLFCITDANSFLPNYHPKLSVLWSYLSQYYTKAMETKKGSYKKRVLEYYKSILDAAPEIEKNQLTLDPEIEITFRDELTFFYGHQYQESPPKQIIAYLLQHNKGSSLTPTLDKAFEQQSKIEQFIKECLSDATVILRQGMGKSYESNHEKKFQNIAIVTRQDYSKNIDFFSTLLGKIYSNSNNDRYALSDELFTRYFRTENSVLLENVLTNGFYGHHYAYDSNQIGFTTSKDNPLALKNKENKVAPLEYSYKDDQIIRKLRYLHLSSSVCIPMLFSELLCNPGWLAEEKYQDYILLSIFKPNILMSTLKEYPDFWDLLNNLLKKHNSEDPCFLNKQEWFLRKLTLLLSEYALKAMDAQLVPVLSQVHINRFKQWHRDMLIAIEQRLAMPLQSPIEREACHQFKLIILLRQGIASRETFEEMLLSYLFLARIPRLGLKKEEMEQVLNQTYSSLFKFCKSQPDALKYLPDQLITLSKQLNIQNDVFFEGLYNVSDPNSFPIFAWKKILAQKSILLIKIDELYTHGVDFNPANNRIRTNEGLNGVDYLIYEACKLREKIPNAQHHPMLIKYRGGLYIYAKKDLAAWEHTELRQREVEFNTQTFEEHSHEKQCNMTVIEKGEERFGFSEATWSQIEKFHSFEPICYEIDLAQRIIQIENKQYEYIPSQFMQSVLYQELFGQNMVYAKKTAVKLQLVLGSGYKETSNCYEWTFNDEDYRLLVFAPGQRAFHLEKKMNDQWYVYQLPSRDIAALYGLLLTDDNYYDALYFSFRKDTLPPLLNQTAYRVWNNQKGQYVITDTANKRLYQGNEKSLHKEGYGEILAHGQHYKKYHPLLARLETECFIEYYIQGKNYFFHLPRYGLTFIEKNESLQTKNEEYEVKIPDGSCVFNTGIILEKVGAQKKERLYLVPIQSFYVACDQDKKPISNAKGTRYLWQHDISNHLASQLQKHNQEQHKKDKGWRYTDSERYLTFTLDVNGQPQPKTAEEQLYLIYLYLSQDSWQHAHDLLNTYRPQGTAKEIQYLHWIITKLPGGNSNLSYRNSPLIAMQTQAIYYMIALASKVKLNPITPTLISSHTDDFIYQAQQELISFVNNLSHQVEEYYERYDNQRNNIPVSMRLSFAQEENLLSYHQAQYEMRKGSKQPRYLGVIGRRYLEHFSSVLPESVPRVAFYCYDKDEQGLMFIQRKKWPAQWKKLCAYKKNMPYEREMDAEAESVMTILSPFMELDTLLINFKAYFNFAIKKIRQEDVEKILLFCRVVAQKKPKNSEEEIFLFAAELLWGAIHCATDKFALNFFEQDLENIQIIADNCPPIPIVTRAICYTEQLIPLNVTSQTKALPTYIPKANIPTLEILDGMQDLIGLREQLQKQEESYQVKYQEIITELQDDAPITFLEQNQHFTNYDQKLLEAYQAKQQKQEELVTKYLQSAKKEVLFSNIDRKCDGFKSQRHKTYDVIKRILEQRHQENIYSESKSQNILEEIGRQHEALTLKSLIKNYPNLSPTTLSDLGFSESAISELELVLHQVFALSNARVRLKKLKEAIFEEEKYPRSASTQKITQTLLTENKASYKYEILFQYIKKLSLRDDQIAILKKLAEDRQEQSLHSYLIQCIMGSGKTKVYAPILAYLIGYLTQPQKAKKLPVLVVPEATLLTNFHDFQATSALLQQEPFLFHFDRNQGTHPAELRQLFERFAVAIENHQYVITTAPSLQSLELKYIEILKQRTQVNQTQEDKNKTAEQLFWLGKTLKFLREHAVGVIDEAQDTLRISKELNYALGTAQNIQPHIRDTILHLYKWMNTVKTKEGKKLTDYLQHPDELFDPEIMHALMKEYMHMLCSENLGVDKDWAWVNALLGADSTKDELHTYISNSFDTPEKQAEFEKKLNGFPLEKKEAWILLREEFNNLLPLTLSKKLNQHYGDSPNPDHHFSIPFRANNTPTDCEFGHFLEKMNYTAQKVFCHGVPYNVFLEILTSLKNAVLREESRNDAEAFFEAIFAETDASLKKLNLTDKNLINTLYEKAKHHPHMVGRGLQIIFAQLKLESEMLRSTGIHLIAMFFQAHLFSGTPVNYRTFHSQIKRDQQAALLIDSLVQFYLENPSKHTAIKSVKTHTPQEFIKTMFATHSDTSKLNALIDCAGQLRGISNMEAAKEIAKQVDKTVKYVLFYPGITIHDQNGKVLYEGDRVYALQAKDPNRTLILLPGTDEKTILDTLKIDSLNQIFTYYPEEQAKGSDIKQSSNARAAVTVKNNTKLSDLLQAVMRLRELGQNQNITLILDPILEQILNQQEGNKLKNLMALCRKNEEESLLSDHFYAGMKKIDNSYRARLLTCMLDRPLADQDKLFTATHPFFIDTQTDDIAKQYQTRPIKKEVKAILEAYNEKNFLSWQALIKQENNPSDLLALEGSLIKEIQNIITETVNNSRSEELSNADLERGSEVKIQQQTQQQPQQKAQIQQQSQLAGNNQFFTINSINLDWTREPYTLNKEQIKISDNMKKYNQIWSFGELYASTNFLYAYQEQAEDDIYNLYTKNLGALLLVKDESSQNIRAIMVCIEEIEALKLTLTKEGNAWLATLGGIHLAGHAALFSQLEQTQELLEQAAFFNGRVDVLLENKSFTWLSQNTKDKLRFLRSPVLEYLKVAEDSLGTLEEKIFPLHDIVERWITSPKDTEALMQEAPDGTRQRLAQLLQTLTQIKDDKLMGREPLFSLDQRLLNSTDHQLIALYKDKINDAEENKICAKIQKLLEQSNFLIHLKIILDKTEKLESKAATKNSYKKAALAARKLYTALDQAQTSLLTERGTIEERLATFKDKTQKAIESELPVLKIHRGWKQIFADIASAIITIMSCCISYLATNRFRLFITLTDSEKKLNDLDKTIQKINSYSGSI